MPVEPPAPSNAPPPAPPPAHLRRPRFSFVWLVPLVAAIIAAYLGYRTVLQEGPLLTITFTSGDDIMAGQTQVKYKAVALGTVESVDLSHDNSQVVVRVRMNNVGTRFLNAHARFWVVRPNFTAGNLSGLSTLVSGAYIAVDPGLPGGQYQDHFTGLEGPPGVRSDEPGQTYQLRTGTIGSLAAGSPVFYRDIIVGEVLGYDIGNGLGPVTVNIFVRAPFDHLIRPQSRFWKSSGITAQLQNGGFHIEFQSLQAIISGGVTFDLPFSGANSAPSPNNTVFPLYNTYDDAQSAGYQNQIPVIAYFTSSVAGLARGAPVDVLGIQVGVVKSVKLIIDPYAGKAKARVFMNIQPERVLEPGQFPKNLRPDQVLQKMVNQGLRAELGTVSYVTGQKDITLAWIAGAKPAPLAREGDALVLPSQSGGLDDIINSVAGISNNLSKVDFNKLSSNLNKLVVTANGTLGNPQIKQNLAELNKTLRAANETLQTMTQTYGDDSNFQRNLNLLMSQANDALRSIRLLADYLNLHPQALLLGRGNP
ncbi:MAG TPA: MlaD family protein [Acidocella sp.]|uniref:PqiB family protein n=1 Tax=Acidocella sp. TaxID=50710 RepID=UPI002C1F6C49|nr:MlaD family protein [Acidocella sp.]HVE22382.1 MlaD family protein [Acidocella sp.]